MTGFGSAGRHHKDGLQVQVTAKSLNSKYLSVKCKAPNGFPEELSYKIEKLVPQYIKRGCIFLDIIISLNQNKHIPRIEINYGLVEAYIKLLRDMIDRYNLSPDIKIADILSLGNIFASPTEEYDFPNFQELVLSVAKEALRELDKAREQEGQALEEFFIKSINKMEVSLGSIELVVPKFLAELKRKTKKAIEELIKEVPADKDQLALQVSTFIDRSDITEEIVRIKSHLKKLHQLISTKEEPIGHSLSFVLQEMQREIMTISAKYNYAPMFPEILKIKEEIEKCKEQALNVE
jgi:uncharacterized protein (TIGR00255 family)